MITPRHIAIIVPNLARGPIPPDRLGVYEYRGVHEWFDQGARNADSYLYRLWG
jgi:hypothetical protein